MANMLTRAVKGYNDFMNGADPRVADMFLMGSPAPTVCIVVVYLFITLYALPKYMEKREPYQLKIPMLMYNLAIVLLSGYICIELCLAAWFKSNYHLGCVMVDYSDSPQARRIINVVYITLLSKKVELLDTILFVLRKKHNQVTFLHVSHHIIMSSVSWLGVKFVAGGMGTLWILINSFVHFVMYSYYFMAALGPQFKKYLWWKRYLTRLQMIQFAVVFSHMLQVFFTDCKYNRISATIVCLVAVYNAVLFTNFYYQAYLRKTKPTQESNGVRSKQE